MKKKNRVQEVEEFRASGAKGKYPLKNMGEIPIGNGKKVLLTKVGDIRYSPIMPESMDELDDVAYEIATIINDRGRSTINFFKVLDEQGESEYPLPCQYGNKIEEYLDTNSRYNQSGFLSEKQLNNTIEMKKNCAGCPFAKECLAVSMTSVQTARTSKNSKIIPNSEPPVSLSEYLIFGGYTPQERGIIFGKVCDILREYDAFQNDGSGSDEDSII